MTTSSTSSRTRRPGRTRPAWAVLAALVATALAAGTTACSVPSPAPSASRAPARRDVTPATLRAPATQRAPEGTRPSCAEVARSLSRTEQVGQLFMMSVSTGGITSAQTAILRRQHVGSVLLLGGSTAGVAVTKRRTGVLRAHAPRPHGVSVLLAVDQEGGTVQRLQGRGFSRIPSARQQARMSDAALTRSARTWGQQLHRAGIDADLAPVADVVPTSKEHTNQPIGVLHRGYGPRPSVVAAKTAAFVTGMHGGGVATAVKHYPGLGRVTGNTDFSTHVVDRTTTRHDAALRGFASSTAAGTDMVMVSSAYYARIDAHHRAVFSGRVMTDMIRGDLGFRGVVVSDSLTTPAVADLSLGNRALTFLRAGGDLVVVSTSSAIAPMARAVSARAASDARFRGQLPEKVARVLAMKARRGLVSCG